MIKNKKNIANGSEELTENLENTDSDNNTESVSVEADNEKIIGEFLIDIMISRAKEDEESSLGRFYRQHWPKESAEEKEEEQESEKQESIVKNKDLPSVLKEKAKELTEQGRKIINNLVKDGLGDTAVAFLSSMKWSGTRMIFSGSNTLLAPILSISWMARGVDRS